MQVDWIWKLKLTTGETVIFAGREDGKDCSGIAIMMSKLTESTLVECRAINDRIMTYCKIQLYVYQIINVYAPTRDGDE